MTVLVGSRPDFYFFESWTQTGTTSPGIRKVRGKRGNPQKAPQRCHVLQGRGSEDVRLNFNLEKSFFNPAKLDTWSHDTFLSASVPRSLLDLWEPFLPVDVNIL